MKKIVLLMVVAFFGAWAAKGGECKNCGSNTDHCAVYRCKKCRTFFCANCRDGDGKAHKGTEYERNLQNLTEMLQAVNRGGTLIVCPECGEQDRMAYGQLQDGKIRLIKE